jgi:23S rRNA pseudouridine2605 synthase
MARAGAASRRASEKLIAAGRVSVNGVVLTAAGTKVLPSDTVCIDGKPALPEKVLHYIALNKPPRYICSSSDTENRPLARDLLPSGIKERLYSVGRLDYMSCGLILFTNDGAFAARLGHPSSEIEKEYLVETSGAIGDAVLDAFISGVEVDGVVYRARRAERLGSRALRVVLIEGRNREIRRVFSHFHLHPVRLRRIRIGPVVLGALAEGESRPLTPAELNALKGRARRERTEARTAVSPRTTVR